MIKYIHTLKRELAGRHIYIWDISKRSTWVLSMLAYRGISVTGFVTDVERFAGETFMNRPVVTQDEYLKDPDAVLIYEDYTHDRVLKEALDLPHVYRYRDTLELNPELFERDLYLYGTTSGAWNLIREMTSHPAGEQEGGVREPVIKGFFLTDPKGIGTVAGLPVLKFENNILRDKEAVAAAVLPGSVTCQILENMTGQGFAGDVYINGLVSYIDMWGTDPFLVLDKALKENKKVFLCSEDALGSELTRRMMTLFGIVPAREVSLKGDAARGLEDIYSLAGEDPAQSVLFISALRGMQRCEIVEAALDLGYTGGAMNYAALQKTCYNRVRSDGTVEYEDDERFLMSIDYSPAGGVPGWSVHGTDDAARTIMVLGGSTSTDIYCQTSWVELLYKKILKAGLSVRIFNGASEMADCQQEYQRMIRDLNMINPDIVISMSGVNDLEKKDNKFERWNSETPFARWRRVEEYLVRAARDAGARPYIFLQPVNLGITDADLHENIQFVHDSRRSGGSFYREPADDDFYTNLFGLFHHREGMFIDCCHYSDEAHEMIAQIVFDRIRDSLT